MRRTEMLQEILRMRFKEVYEEWDKRRLTQEEAAQILGVSDRTFRRYINCVIDAVRQSLQSGADLDISMIILTVKARLTAAHKGAGLLNVLSSWT